MRSISGIRRGIRRGIRCGISLAEPTLYVPLTCDLSISTAQK
jgi:hypothetical protein